MIQITTARVKQMSLLVTDDGHITPLVDVELHDCGHHILAITMPCRVPFEVKVSLAQLCPGCAVIDV